jgi:hypothetical protein
MSSGPQFSMDDYDDPFDDDRGRTFAVLMDVGEARKKTDENLATLGDVGIAATADDVPFGLKPHLDGMALESLKAVVHEPSWANTLYAAVVSTISAPEEQLREYLVQVAAITVQWAEIIDKKKEKA